MFYFLFSIKIMFQGRVLRSKGEFTGFTDESNACKILHNYFNVAKELTELNFRFRKGAGHMGYV